MKKFFGVGVAIVATTMAGIPVIGHSQLEHQHAAHVHGESTGTMALDGGRLELELTLPGYNLVGFEHAPRTSEQRAALDDVVAYLSEGAWLKPHAGSNCQVTELFAGRRGFAEQAQDDDAGHAGGDEADHHHDHDDDDHDHGHEHDDGHSHDHTDFDSEHDQEHGHAEFHVLARLDCATPDRLDYVELNVFERFPDNDVLILDVLTEQIAGRVRLRKGAERVELRADR